MSTSGDDTARGLSLVSASAGSGKTYRLTREVTQWLSSPQRDIAVEGLVAVTYTTKAQAELESRLRRTLIEHGEFARAEALPLAYLGTVHAVCLRLLKEFALDTGWAPDVEGLPQQAARHLLQEALERALAPELRRRLDDAARALELSYDHRTKRFDWITPVEQIVTLARNNRLDPERLPEMAQRSVRGLLELLPPAVRDGESLERALGSEISAAIDAITQLGCDQGNTQSALKDLREARHALGAGGLPWSAWCKLTKLAPGKRALPLIAGVQAAAGEYSVHPRFQAQLRELCELIFEAARVALDAYANWKLQRGLLDYVDMIDHALRALDVPEVAAELAQRLELSVVDEFQDTSPVQLALFTRLHALCKRSLWVGDRKQCIFEYAGADPSLMDAVTRWVGAHGGSTETLGKNYRSRPELVNANSALFSRAFATHTTTEGDRTQDDATSLPHREPRPELDALPPFGVWWLACKHNHEMDAVAEGVRRLLAEPEQTPVLDRTTGQVRPLRPQDVAVLLATNKEAEKLSTALTHRGIVNVLPRTGLMTTPEGTLLSAALGYLVNERDTLACAQVEALLGFEGHEGHEAWLSERVRAHTERAEESAPAASEALRRLAALRPQLSVLSPAELVLQVFAALDFPRLCRRWPDPTQRLDNLDALRALSLAYENRAQYLREAASLAGLLRYFDEAQIAIQQRDEERASDEQHVGSPEHAVTLCTYHKSKGLEWPVVVLASLERNGKRDAFEVTPEADRESFDASDPLGGRWIRYWPWPLGLQKNAPLRERAATSKVGRRIAQSDARERVRLLYVGFTRARDHLILAIPSNAKGKPRTAWLDELADDEGPLLSLPPAGAAPAVLGIRGAPHALRVPARVWQITADTADTAADSANGSAPPVRTEQRLWFAATAGARSEVRYAIQPSSAASDPLPLPLARVTSQERFTQRIPFTRSLDEISGEQISWDQVGTALHAFLAADRVEFSLERRLELARALLTASALQRCFDPAAWIAASDALYAFCEQRWPGAHWHREIPITAVLDTEHGARRVRGTIDLLLETPTGVVLIDHKSFPGRSEHWGEQALKHAPQLAVYATALAAAGHRVLGRWVHFTVGGGAVELAEA